MRNRVRQRHPHQKTDLWRVKCAGVSLLHRSNLIQPANPSKNFSKSKNLNHPNQAVILTCCNGQDGRMSESRFVTSQFFNSFRSANSPIIPALSVQRVLSARRNLKCCRSQASASAFRSALLQITPPDPVTHFTPDLFAARIVFVTSTSTIAAWTLAQRSRMSGS